MATELPFAGSVDDPSYDFEHEESDFAAQGKSLLVKLGGKTILRNLDIEVKRGTVFTLLGPSGCGKTTLMKTLLGLYVPNEGERALLGFAPRSQPLHGKISYVPQSLGLHKNLEVGEHLAVYARIVGMNQAQIEARLAEYQKRFRLPDRKELVSELSFGQQKLVSVCAALISDPLLAVLDEPTVGLDPYRRSMLWDYFGELAAKGHTIFVTTHHVNEAYRANTVAIMYQGRLLIQAAPQEVVRAMQVATLEEAYLQAYNGKATLEDSVAVRTPSKIRLNTWKRQSLLQRIPQLLLTIAVVTKLFYKTVLSIPSFLAFAALTSSQMFRNMTRNLMAFAMVTSQFLIVSYCVGPLSFDLPVHILNEDSGIAVGSNSYFYGNTMQNILISDPDTKMNWALDPRNSTHNGLSMISGSESFGLLHIFKNFSQVMNASGNNPKAELPFALYLDATDTNIRGQVIGEVFRSWSDTLLDSGFNYELQNPQRVINYIRGSTQSMTNFFITAIFIAMTVVGGMFSAGTAFMREKEHEALDRLQAMGIQAWVIFVADLLPFIPWVFADFPVRFCVALSVMDGPFHGRILPLVVLNVIGFSMGNAIGVLCAVLVSSSRDLMQLLYTIFFFLYLPSGCIWPIESQPHLMYVFAELNPLMWLVRAFRYIFMRNAAITSQNVLPAFLVPVVIGVAAFFMAGVHMAYHTPVTQRLEMWWERKFQKRRRR